MRTIVIAAAVAAIPTLASAQYGTVPSGRTYQGSPPYQGNYPYQPPYQSSARSAMPPMASSRLDPENCGTPDEPKACPPMPRRPLRDRPANRE